MTLRPGDLFCRRYWVVASSRAAPSMRAPALSNFSPRWSRETARARNSPRLSQRRWFSASNCWTCLGALPPAPVSKSPPPFISVTMESILALVPTSKMGKRSVR